LSTAFEHPDGRVSRGARPAQKGGNLRAARESRHLRRTFDHSGGKS
jgi:hypothetical protein